VSELARQAKSYLAYRLTKPNPTQTAIERLETRLEQGELQIQVNSIESDRALKTLTLSVKALIYACISGFAALTGAILLVGQMSGGAIFAFTIAGITSLFLLKALIRLMLRDRIDRMID
jgi:hypothetical protein